MNLTSFTFSLKSVSLTIIPKKCGIFKMPELASHILFCLVCLAIFTWHYLVYNIQFVLHIHVLVFECEICTKIEVNCTEQSLSNTA